MKKPYLLAAYAAVLAITACTDNEYINDTANPQGKANQINFAMKTPALTRGDIVGASAAELLGGNFIVMGTKGTEAADAPSSTVVFDNYLVTYEANSAGKTDSNTHNWEYVGQESGTTLVPADTWNALHAEDGNAKSQTIKFWDYSTDQYDFIAYSTGTAKAVTATPNTGEVQVTRIAKGTTLSSAAYSFTAPSVNELKQVYVTDITPVKKAQYGNVVTLKFKNLTSKIRVGLYETVPGYSVKGVKFYTVDGGVTPSDLGNGTQDEAVLFTTGEDEIPASGTITVSYPSIGTSKRTAKDYNKAAVMVTAGDTKVKKLEYGVLTNNYTGKDKYETDENIYLGRSLPTATMAGSADAQYYTPVMPNNNAKTLTLRVDYTLVSTDGSGEEIKVYGAKAVVPSTYTEWQPNYAYTYIFKISDNTNGWTSKDMIDTDGDGTPDDLVPAGLYPITFDAVVAEMTDANAEQTTITTVATPSITTYQQGHDWKNKNEYSKSQTAGVSTAVKKVYVQVMNNKVSPAKLVEDLDATNSQLLKLSDDDATEAAVMDAFINNTKGITNSSIVGRNGLTLVKNNGAIDNTVTSIENGVDDNPVTVATGTTAAINIATLATGTYAYVYTQKASTKIINKYQPIVVAVGASVADGYVDIDVTTAVAATTATAAANKLYFSKTTNGTGTTTYSYVTTKEGDDVTGLYEIDMPASPTLTSSTTATAGHMYFDVYKQNDGVYAVKVIKVVA